MNSNSTNFIDGENQDEGFDVKRFIFLMRRQWHWLALLGVLGTILAFGYSKISKPQYMISTSILVPEKSDALNMKNMFQGLVELPKNNIYNQIEIINSYYNINQALLNLNWRTSWYSKDMFVWEDIYKQEPFDVQEAQNFMNPSGIAIFITPISNDTYNISVNGKQKTGSQIRDIKFEGSGTFGRPFTNNFFNFTLLKKVTNFETISGRYYFVFNNLNNTTLAYMKKLKTILKDKNGDIIECSIEGEQPYREGDFLNELIKVYIGGKMDFQSEAQRRSLDFINDQLRGISDSLNTAGTKYTNFRSQNNIINLGTEGNLVMNSLKEIESDQAKSQMQLDYFQNLLKYLDNNNDLKQVVSPSVVGIQDVSLNALLIKLGDLYNRRQVLSFSAKENNPTLVMLDKELNQVRSQLNENVRNLIDNVQTNINSQKGRKDKISFQLSKLPQQEQKMVNIQRQFNLTNEIYTFLLQKRAETNITLASTTPDVRVIDVARPETASPIGLNSRLLLGLGFFLGIGLPITFLLLFNFFDDRIRTQKDLEKSTSIPILGNIMHSQIKSDLVVHENPKSTIAESFRELRTNLQFMISGTTGKVLSIHSTNPGEGKSFTSVNLATILAMNNKKVVIIGADLRKPRLHKIFNFPNENGLSNYLIGVDSINQIIFPTSIENLSFLPSGPIPPNPAEILGKPEMKNLIDSLRSQFDYVIIDNAPTAMVTDGSIVSHLSDLNIFILRYGVSHKHEIEMINQYSSQKTIENISIIVNDIMPNAFGNSYYKYYQYEANKSSYYAEQGDVKKHRLKKKSL